jgi:hypothetical protein
LRWLAAQEERRLGGYRRPLSFFLGIDHSPALLDAAGGKLSSTSKTTLFSTLTKTLQPMLKITFRNP